MIENPFVKSHYLFKRSCAVYLSVIDSAVSIKS